jgi:uncharacterized membrane protein (UPF0127 family)
MTDTPAPPPAPRPAPAPLKRPKDLHERDRPWRTRVPGAKAQQWMVVVLLLAAGCGFVVKGADKPADPVLREPTRQAVEGFGEIAYRVNRLPAATRCALLAQTEAQQSRGLMNRRDLAGYDGMLFLFANETNGAFWMKDTPLPLSIAFFDSGGRFVSSSDMDPCIGQPNCTLYTATGPYRYALEVPRGQLDELGIGSGAVISVGGPCA